MLSHFFNAIQSFLEYFCKMYPTKRNDGRSDDNYPGSRKREKLEGQYDFSSQCQILVTSLHSTLEITEMIVCFL